MTRPFPLPDLPPARHPRQVSLPVVVLWVAITALLVVLGAGVVMVRTGIPNLTDIVWPAETQIPRIVE